MCAGTWSTEYPIHIEQRSKERVATLIEGFFTTTYNAMRRHMPETMQVVENE